MEPVRVAIIGAGVMGRRHLERIRKSGQCVCVAICDTDPKCQTLADKLGVSFYADYEEMLDWEKPQGAVIATPTNLHTAVGLACAERSVHILMEKPLAASVDEGRELIDAGRHSQTQLLVGHYRRFNPYVRKARSLVQAEIIGKLVSVSALWALLKPAEYFELSWRTKPGGGPMMTNAIHEIDCLRYICGEITNVYAVTRSSVRGLEVEDTANISIEFESGALGSIVCSDATPSPWSYETTTFEIPYYYHTDQNCMFFLGTKGSFSFPRMEVWRYPDTGGEGWRHPLTVDKIDIQRSDPMAAQIKHFARVIRGEEEPEVNGEDGLRTLATTLAVLESAGKRMPVQL